MRIAELSGSFLNVPVVFGRDILDLWPNRVWAGQSLRIAYSSSNDRQRFLIYHGLNSHSMEAYLLIVRNVKIYLFTRFSVIPCYCEFGQFSLNLLTYLYCTEKCSSLAVCLNFCALACCVLPTNLLKSYLVVNSKSKATKSGIPEQTHFASNPSSLWNNIGPTKSVPEQWIVIPVRFKTLIVSGFSRQPVRPCT